MVANTSEHNQVTPFSKNLREISFLTSKQTSEENVKGKLEVAQFPLEIYHSLRWHVVNDS